MLSMKDTITGDDPFYGPREANRVVPTGHTDAITGWSFHGKPAARVVSPLKGDLSWLA
jgi:hypothetical protein